MFGNKVGKHDHNITPISLLKDIEQEFGLFHDPCPLFGEEWDGLSSNWGEVNFIHPPFSNVEPWIIKAIIEKIDEENTSILLLPAKTNTKYWMEYVFPFSDEIRWLQKGIKFESDFAEFSQPYPYELVLVIFDGTKKIDFKNIIQKKKKKSYSYFQTVNK